MLLQPVMIPHTLWFASKFMHYRSVLFGRSVLNFVNKGPVVVISFKAGHLPGL